MKVLGIRETRRIHSLTNLDPGAPRGRTSNVMVNGHGEMNTVTLIAVLGESSLSLVSMDKILTPAGIQK